MSRSIYLPWPLVMALADQMEREGYKRLAIESRKLVWDEAERRFNAANGN